MPCCLYWASEASHLVGGGHCGMKEEAAGLGRLGGVRGALVLKGLPGGAPLYHLPGRWGASLEKEKRGEYKIMIGNWELVEGQLL